MLNSLDLVTSAAFTLSRSRSIKLILTRSQIASPHTRRDSSRELGGGWMFSGGWKEGFWGCYPETRMRAPSQRLGFARPSPSGRDVEPHSHPRDKKGARATTHGLPTAGIQPLPRREGNDVILRSTHQNNTLQSSKRAWATWFLAVTLENVKHLGVFWTWSALQEEGPRLRVTEMLERVHCDISPPPSPWSAQPHCWLRQTRLARLTFKPQPYCFHLSLQ